MDKHLLTHTYPLLIHKLWIILCQSTAALHRPFLHVYMRKCGGIGPRPMVSKEAVRPECESLEDCGSAAEQSVVD